jgi:hypothetical protein
MNTPAHAVLNLWILGRKDRPGTALPIVIGSILPDVPIFAFYTWAKLVERLPEPEIWSRAYLGWKGAWTIDLLHSAPVVLAALLLAWRLGLPRLTACFAGMALHVPEDFFFHSEDAHRHFFPFSDWRFHSPVSYWDPSHYGRIVAPLEMIAVFVGCIVLFRRYESRAARWVIAAVMAMYGLFLGYAIWAWG